MSEDKRNNDRIHMTGAIFIEVTASEGHAQNRILICRSFDISPGGLRVGLDEPIEIGSILQLGADLVPGRDPLYLVGEVRWTEPRDPGPGYWVGFELLDSADTDIAAWRELQATLARPDD